MNYTDSAILEDTFEIQEMVMELRRHITHYDMHNVFENIFKDHSSTPPSQPGNLFLEYSIISPATVATYINLK